MDTRAIIAALALSACGVSEDTGTEATAPTGPTGPSHACPGCMSGGVCQPGNAPAACGSGGGSCAACRPYEVCPSSACVVNPDSLWRVGVSSIVFATVKTDGTSWDAFGGAPDPYVCFHQPATASSTDCTTPATDAFSVAPNQTIKSSVKASVLLGTDWQVAAWDDDVSDDDYAGGFSGVPASVLVTGGAQGTTAQGATITLTLTPL